ncbi:MAG: glycosyltransferase family 4 protein [Candidatus Omnitrophica bacterium]|nr:glycosyltransferase family 4 protein [Candidatus Omnitrophota bacterium]
MRVLHICQRDDPSTGGALRVAEALVREQRRAGVDARVLFLYGAPGELSAEFVTNAVCLRLSSSKQAFQGITALRRKVRETAPDIIHSHDGIYWPRLAYMWRRAPLVAHAHAPWGSAHPLKDCIGLPLIKMTTDRLIGISQYSIDIWIKKGFPFQDISLIPNGVDFDRFKIPDVATKAELRDQLGLPQKKRIIVWVGRFCRAMKGTDRVENVVNALPDDISLVMVGDGPENTGIKERNQMSIERGRLILTGSTRDPGKFYRASDAFLFTSYHEPFGLVILEAIASGLPILTYPVSGGGGAVDLLKEFEATLLDDDASNEAIVSAIDHACKKQTDAERLRKQAMDTYAWPSISARVVKIYDKLLAEWEGQ